MNVDYSVKSLNPRHACMAVDEWLYDTPHDEEGVGDIPTDSELW